MNDEKRNYVRLMMEDSFSGVFKRDMKEADLASTPADIDAHQADAFCQEMAMMYQIEVTADQTLGELVEAAYQASKNQMLTAEELVNAAEPEEPYADLPDETASFLDRCDHIEQGLHALANELYALTENSSSESNTELVRRAEEKVSQYDNFIGSLTDPDDIEEANDVLARPINQLRTSIAKLT